MALDPVQNLLPSWLRTDGGTRGPISGPAEGGADDRS